MYYNDQLKPNELSDLCDAMLSKVTEDMSQIPDGLSGGVKEPMSEAEKKEAMMVALLKKPMSEAEKDAMMVSRLKGRIELDSENLGKLADCLKAFVFRETALTPKVQQWLDKLDKDVDRSKAYAWLLQVSGEKWLAGVFKDCRMPKCDEIAIYNTLNNMTLDAYKPSQKIKHGEVVTDPATA